MPRWDLVYKWADPETRSLVDAVTSALENCDRKLTEALAATPPSGSGEASEGLDGISDEEWESRIWTEHPDAGA